MIKIKIVGKGTANVNGIGIMTAIGIEIDIAGTIKTAIGMPEKSETSQFATTLVILAHQGPRTVVSLLVLKPRGIEIYQMAMRLLGKGEDPQMMSPTEVLNVARAKIVIGMTGADGWRRKRAMIDRVNLRGAEQTVPPQRMKVADQKDLVTSALPRGLPKRYLLLHHELCHHLILRDPQKQIQCQHVIATGRHNVTLLRIWV